MAEIDKKTLEYLTQLARIDLAGSDIKEEKLLKDLQSILSYFDELKEVNTDDVEPMAGATSEVNALREDEEATRDGFDKLTAGKKSDTRNSLLKSFPEKEGDFLKVPPIFE